MRKWLHHKYCTCVNGGSAAWHTEFRKKYKLRTPNIRVIITATSPSNVNTMQRFTSPIVLLGLSAIALAAAQIPYYPNITDPNFPLGSRCIDYCAFLRPGQICPGHPLDVNCLCEVYNERLSPVIFAPLLKIDGSANNAGPTKILRLPMIFLPSRASVPLILQLLPSRPPPAAQVQQLLRPVPRPSPLQVLLPLIPAVERPPHLSKQAVGLPHLVLDFSASGCLDS